MDGALKPGPDAAAPTGTRLDVRVTGLNCAACVRRVERAIAAVPGVGQVGVNLATERASITAGPEIKAAAIADALRTAGYPAVEDTIDLTITGMTCASCAARVERALLSVPGVIAAPVNSTSERARIHILAGAATAAELEAAVERAGYHAHLPETAGNTEAAASRTREQAARREGVLALLACAFAFPLLLPMLLMPFGIDAKPAHPVQLALAAIMQFVFGARFYRGAWKALRAGTGNMDTLVALGTSAAFGLSLWALAAGRGGPLYFEASAVVIALVRSGKWLESRARRQAGEAIRALERLRPDHARVRRDGTERDIPTAELRTGDLLVIRPGERIAADGIVREGTGSADESLLTGESLPVPKEPGRPVTGGALNGEALLVAEVTAAGAESQLARIVRLVEDAQADKPPVQRLVDRGQRRLCARGARHRPAHLPRLVGRRRRGHRRRRQRRRRAGHRLPLRPRPRHPGRHHRRHRRRRPPRHPHPRRRRPGTVPHDPHRRVRQNRHPDGGPAPARRAPPRRRHDRRRRPPRRRRPAGRQRTPPRPRRRHRRRRPGHPARDRPPRPTRPRPGRRGRRPPPPPRQRPPDGRSRRGHRTPADGRHKPASRRPHRLLPGRPHPPSSACSPSATRSNPAPPPPSPSSAPPASASCC